MGGFFSYAASFAASPPLLKHPYNLTVSRVVHKVVDDAEIGEKRVLIVGDIHGCFDEMIQLLSRADALDSNTNRVRDNCCVVFCGDFVNKGPKSIEVLRYIMEQKILTVRGNHEEAVLREFMAMKQDKSYELRKKYRWLVELHPEEVDFLTNLPYTICIPAFQLIVVHAGLVPGVPLDYQDLHNLTTMRTVRPEPVHPGLFYSKLVASSKYTKDSTAWAPVWKGPLHVYFGHDAKKGLQNNPYSTGLDSGCVYGATLTGVLIERDRRSLRKSVITIQAAQVYQKPEGN